MKQLVFQENFQDNNIKQKSSHILYFDRNATFYSVYKFFDMFFNVVTECCYSDEWFSEKISNLKMEGTSGERKTSSVVSTQMLFYIIFNRPLLFF